MMTKLGIPSSHIVKVTNPYQATEIIKGLPEEEKSNTVLIFAVSAKDQEGKKPRFTFGTKRNGNPSYMQPMPDNTKQLEPLTKHAYVTVVPTVNFKVRGADANSATEIRQQYIKGNQADREQIIHDLYGTVDPELKNIFDKKLGVAERAQEFVKEARNIRTERSIAWLKQVLILEQKAHPDPMIEDLRIDYIEEKRPRKI